MGMILTHLSFTFKIIKITRVIDINQVKFFIELTRIQGMKCRIMIYFMFIQILLSQ